MDLKTKHPQNKFIVSKRRGSEDYQKTIVTEHDTFFIQSLDFRFHLLLRSLRSNIPVE